MIKTLFAWIVPGLILLTGIWYFILKDSDYSVSFRSSGGTGEIYQSLLYYPFDKEFESSTITGRIPFEKLIQEVNIEDEKLELTWNISEEKDSGSIVKVEINSSNQFQNRLNFLFRSNELQTKIIERIKKVKVDLEENSELYEVTIIGQTKSPETTCACISLKNELNKKAFDMIKNISLLSDFIIESEAEMTAKPRIVVQSWDIKSNSIVYDFCFPIIGEDLSPPTGISIKEFPSVNSIKATYNGNYMYSHLAWMKLLEYAENQDLEVKNTPLEIFNDNPEMGGDARNWEAEIYLPLK